MQKGLKTNTEKLASSRQNFRYSRYSRYQSYVIYKKLGEEKREGIDGGMAEVPGCLDYLVGKDECETKRWKNRAEVYVITGTGRDTVRR